MKAKSQSKLFEALKLGEPSPRLTATLIGILTIILAFRANALLPRYYLVAQDLPVIPIIAILIWLVFYSSTGRGSGGIRFVDTPRSVIATAIILIAIGFGINHLILHNYAFSRDEQMALQDATIFASGRWAAVVPPEWRGMEWLLNRTFNSNTFATHITISDYRPVNALIHSLFMRVNAVDLTAPVMAAIAFLATWRVARRLWPDQSEPRVISLILLATSVQFWALAGTPYAMTALLALNMLWLALFLKDTSVAHALAIIVGALATGLHQAIYHPLFAFPFLCLLLVKRRWWLAGVYTVCYAAIFAFWFRYPVPLLPLSELPLAVADKGGLNHSMGLAAALLDKMQPSNFAFTATNIVRFFAWQNIILLPLLIAAFVHAKRTRDPFQLALAAAILLPVTIKLILVPYQGHGWGYRYEHGALGAVCLFAGYGWMALRDTGRANIRLFAIATAATVCVTGPWLLSRASIMSGGYAAIDQGLAKIDADIVLVDVHQNRFEQDILINNPDLKSRPIRVLAVLAGPNEIARLCKMGTLAFWPGSRNTSVGNLYGMKSGVSPEYQSALNEARARCPQQIRWVG